MSADKVVDEHSEYDNRGNRDDYTVYEDENGDRYEERTGGASRNDILGFEDDEHFEDNML